MTAAARGPDASLHLVMGAEPSADALGAPLLRRHVGDRLRERPAVAGQVLGGVLALPVALVRRNLNDPRARSAGLGVVRVGVVDADDRGVAHHTSARRAY